MRLGGSAKEVDEALIGGAVRFMHADKSCEKITDRGVKGRAAVMGILDRGGNVRANVIPTRCKHHLQAEIRAHVKAHGAINTDALPSYQGLNPQDFIHQTINHAESFVDGQVHTNGLENFRSLLKRGLKGTYVTVEPFHLFRYLYEEVVRCNNRAKKNHFLGDGDLFQMAMCHIAGRRITFKNSLAKGLIRRTTKR